MLRSILLSVTLLATTGACYHGPSLKKFEPAHAPDGIDADLRLERARVRGELLAVEDSTLVVLSDARRVVMVPVAKIRLGSFGELGTLLGEWTPSQETMERLRLVSRFPAGLTPELRGRLLAAYGQTELEVVQ